jgi:hypothetical protein
MQRISCTLLKNSNYYKIMKSTSIHHLRNSRNKVPYLLLLQLDLVLHFLNYDTGAGIRPARIVWGTTENTYLLGFLQPETKKLAGGGFPAWCYLQIEISSQKATC